MATMPETPCFTEGQILDLHELAGREGLDSHAFRIMAVLQGGMGVCLKIRSESSGGTYALKAAHSDLVENQIAWARFVEEMKVWLTLSAYDGVAEAYCIAKVNELPCICARWMEGGNLRPFMRHSSPEFYLGNAYRVVRTLGWVYENHRIIHRDLKPENLLLDKGGLAYITDWGLARPLAAGAPKVDAGVPRKWASRPELTQAGRFLGTLLYASPEQILGLKHIDHRSDIYGLGCVLYEWETGGPPFGGADSDQIAYSHVCNPPPLLASLPRVARFGTGEIIARCLEKDPDRRFPDFPSLAQALLKVAADRGIELERFLPRERYSMPQVGQRQFRGALISGQLGGVPSRDSGHALLKMDRVVPFLREAEALVGLGEWKKALEIYEAVFVPEMARSLPDHPWTQAPTVGYALCLMQVGRPSEALAVLQCISGAKTKPAEYYVNLSLAYLQVKDAAQAERVAKAGIAVYPSDKDVLGNLLIAQINQGKYEEALVTAHARLKLGHDVHCLEEVGVLHTSVGEKCAHTDWPKAVSHYRFAVNLLREAKQLNPRYAIARYDLAKAWFELERYAKAMEELDEIAQAQLPMHSTLKEQGALLWARCLNITSLFGDCVKFCTDALIKWPESVPLRRILSENVVDGFCIGNMKDGLPVVEPSSLEFFTWIVTEPERREVSDFCYLARLRNWMGELDEALRLLEHAETLSPDCWDIPFNRAFFHEGRGKLQPALSEGFKAAKLAPWLPQPWRLLAGIFEALGDQQRATQAARRAEEIKRKRRELTSWADQGEDL